MSVMQKYALVPASQYHQLVKAPTSRVGGAPLPPPSMQDSFQASMNGESPVSSPSPPPPTSSPPHPPPPGQGVKYIDESQDDADLRWVDIWQSI